MHESMPRRSTMGLKEIESAYPKGDPATAAQRNQALTEWKEADDWWMQMGPTINSQDDPELKKLFQEWQAQKYQEAGIAKEKENKKKKPKEGE